MFRRRSRGRPARTPQVAAPWVPTNLDGCSLWLRADLGVTLNGSDVSAWADQSGQGNSFDQATATKQPLWTASLLNGKPGITFDGVDDALEETLFDPGGGATTDKITVALVVEFTGGGTHSFIEHGDSGTADGCFRIRQRAVGSIIRMSQKYNAGTNNGDASGVSAAVHRVICRFDRSLDGTSVVEGNMHLDGTSQSLTLSSAINTTGNYITTDCTLGSRSDGAGQQFDGDLHEVVLYNRLLTDAELTRLDKYMKDFWRL